MGRSIRNIPSSLNRITARTAGASVPRLHKVVSLFSGCGGMDLGFLGGFRFGYKTYDPLPFEIVWANDVNVAACRTYERNFGREIHRGDVWECMETLPKAADVVIGGFPCQDISINGRHRAGVNGRRSGLYRAMVEVVKELKPKIFVAENVKSLLMDYNKESLQRVLTDFRALNYSVRCHLYNAADFGVPQTRERVFIIGTFPRINAFTPPAVERSSENWMTSREAISDLEGYEEGDVPNHIWSKAARSPEQGNRQIKADRPADTIRAECHGNIQFHYDLPRRLSMREAARIQSFPDDFVFAAKLRETERQVGNAVPPVLAWHIAKAVRDCLA